MPGKCDVFIVFGASGDLSKKKIYPTLWFLYRQKFISLNTKFIGYARSKISVDDIRKASISNMDVKEDEHSKLDEFFANNYYLSGKYDDPKDFKALNNLINKVTGKENSKRIFYLALPPSVFSQVTSMIRQECWPEQTSSKYVNYLYCSDGLVQLVMHEQVLEFVLHIPIIL